MAIQLAATPKPKKRTTQVKVLLNEEELDLLDKLVEKTSTDRATVFRNLLTTKTHNTSSNEDSKAGLTTACQSNSFNTVFFDFKDFNEGLSAIDCLKNGQTIVCSIGSLEPDLAQRIIDFLAGATSLSNGNAEQINPSVFLFTSNTGQLGVYDNKNGSVTAYLTSSQKRLLQANSETPKLESGNIYSTNSSTNYEHNGHDNSLTAVSSSFEEFLAGPIEQFVEQLSDKVSLLLDGTREAYGFTSNVQSISLLLHSIFSENDLSLETLSKKSESLNTVSFEPQMIADSEIIDCVMRGKDLFPSSLIEKLDAFKDHKALHSPEDVIKLILNSLIE